MGDTHFPVLECGPVPQIDSAVARLAALMPKRRWKHKASIPHANINAKRSEIATQPNTVGCAFVVRLAALMPERGRRHEDFHPSLEYQSKERHERLKRDTPSLEKVNSEQSKMASRQTGTIAIIIRLIDAREGKDAQCSHP